MRRLLTWLYMRFLRDYVLVDILLSRAASTNTLYVVHLAGGQVVRTEDRSKHQERWN